MNKIRIYNDEEIKILLNNPNVDRIKNKSQIVYKNEFKLWAVKEKLNHTEKTAREIFVAGKFDMNILDDRTPQKRLCLWVKKYKMFGEDYFTNKNKYSYSAKEKNENKTNNELENKFVSYVRKVINNPKFVAFIIDKDETGKLRINNLVSIEDEKINN
jgi:hypothetical protein